MDVAERRYPHGDLTDDPELAVDPSQSELHYHYSYPLHCSPGEPCAACARVRLFTVGCMDDELWPSGQNRTGQGRLGGR
jgi:hypothetical protein